MTQGIVSGLKDRSRYLLNRGVFTRRLAGGQTLFEHSLFEERRKQPATPLIGAGLPADVRPLKIPPLIGETTIQMYQCALDELCQAGENRLEYEETAKHDARNILLYNKRITEIGVCVAEAKIQKTPDLLSLESDDEIKGRIVVPEIEDRVVETALEIARQCGLGRQLQLIEKFFREIMCMTVYVEIMYVQTRKASGKPS